MSGQTTVHREGPPRALAVSSRIITCADDARDAWLALQAHSTCSYFQSWGWIGTWLECVAGDLERALVEVRDGPRVIAMGVFVPAAIKRRGLIRSQVLFLNEYPLAGRNMVIEYNGLLIDDCVDDPAGVYAALLGHLLSSAGATDEVNFSALAGCEALQQALGRCGRGFALVTAEESCAWQVELNGLQSGLDGYLGSLSKNRRGQIRRSLRLYEARGALTLDVAGSAEEALAFFQALGQLHAARWQRKGMSGSFANENWVDFHRALIRGRFASGEIQLLRVRSGESDVGYLYNFLWRDRVYVLQTGFAISDDKRLMPGYVVHALAIAHNGALGMKLYDFMHGDSVYKRVLSNRSEPLYWLTVQKSRLKFRAEASLLRLYRGLRAALRRARADAP